MKIDNYYKFVASTFGFAYFTGITVGVVYSLLGITISEKTNYINLFFLQSTIQFKNVFINHLQSALQQLIVPFLYLIESVKFGFLHAGMLTSPFLGQIKLFVQLFPHLFYFISFIVFSTIGLKIVLFIIESLTNTFYKKKKKTIIKLKIFNKNDILLIYFGLISLCFGVLTQLFLSKIFFIFLINFQMVTYVFIIITYLILIILSLMLTYKTINSLIESFNKIVKK
jgi:hypothetical protein